MSRTRKIVYWVATLWLALGMTATGIGQVLKIHAGQGALDQITHLGYPVYLLSILGVWKVLGVIAVLAPNLPRLKEWAYAGFFFVTTGAIVSHVMSGDPLFATLPALLLLVLTLLSWHFRPASRKLIGAAHG
jgi:uncharacterized membrane protein YphA (DoxX/SURF4 family)